MALTPQFAAVPKVGIATINTANANRDGTGSLTSVLAAGANGTRLRGCAIKATATTTAGMVRLYIHDGTTAHLWKEVPVSAITPSAMVESFSAALNEVTNPELFPLTLPTGYSLRASTEKAESFRVIAEGADL